MKCRIERNTAVSHPPEQEWRVWQIDDYGDEWTVFFAPTKAKAEKWAKRHRNRDIVHSRAASRSINRVFREYLGLAVPPGAHEVRQSPVRFRAALEKAFAAGYKMAHRALSRRPRKH